MTRKSISKTIRFEVFKRDQFSCQYCGAKAPEVVLHLDHIHPVAEGGGNEIMNLLTACASCNGGKGARLLDDKTAVQRQRAQIEELEARREQLEMMLQWRDAAQAGTVDTVEAVADRVAERGRFGPNESGKAHIRRWLKKYSLPEILDALDEAFDHYMRFNGDEPDQKSWEVAFAKIPAIASLKRQAVEKPYMPRLAYIQGILRKRFDDSRGSYIAELEDIHGWGVTLEQMETAAKSAVDMGDYWDDMVVIGKAIKAEQDEGN